MGTNWADLGERRSPLRRGVVDGGSWAAVGGGCIALLVAGCAWRWPTLSHLGDYDRFSMTRLAYSDIIKLYFTRGLSAHLIPYLQQPVEYPVVTGFVMWLTSFAPGIQVYFLVNAGLLVAAGIGTVMYLAQFVSASADSSAATAERRGGEREPTRGRAPTRGAPTGVSRARRVARFALAPPLAFYVALNWDMLSVLALSAALVYMSRARPAWAGLSLGIGASTKLYPAFVLPAFLALALAREVESRDQRIQETLELLTAFVIAAAALNAPIARLNFSGWSFFLHFQAGRPPDPDSIWAHLPALPDIAVWTAFVSVFLIGIAWTSFRVLVNRGRGWEAASAISLLLFLALTRDYSPQYDLWVLPLLAILPCPIAIWGFYILADALYYVTIFLYLSVGFGGRPPPVFASVLTLGVAVWIREAALVVVLIWSLRLLVRVIPRGSLDQRLVASGAAILAVVAAGVGGAIVLLQAIDRLRASILVGEMVALGVVVLVATGWSVRRAGPDALWLATACLVPMSGVVLFNFATVGYEMVPSLCLAGIAVVEGWMARRNPRTGILRAQPETLS